MLDSEIAWMAIKLIIVGGHFLQFHTVQELASDFMAPVCIYIFGGIFFMAATTILLP